MAEIPSTPAQELPAVNQLQFDELVNELVDASRLYYQSGTDSPLSDEEYDLKLEHLQEVISQQPELSSADFEALVEEVASGTAPGAGRKVIHERPMLSLQKANSEAGITEFLLKTEKFGAGEQGWILQAKLDGIALSATYSGGELTQLATRGTGQVGEDVTGIAKSSSINIDGLPREIPGFSGELRGEIFMTAQQFARTDQRRYEVLKKHNDRDTVTKKKSEEDLHFSNPRNATAGILNREDYSLGFLAELTFFVYTDSAQEGSLPESGSGNDLTRNVTDFTDSVLRKSGLGAKCATHEAVLAGIKAFGRERLEPDFPVPTDGIVVKCANDAQITAAMGFTAHHPSSQIAFKYPGVTKESEVLEIQTAVGRTGRLSVRARISPVSIDGSTINFASLHNFRWLEERDVRVGSRIAVKKANDIIPYVAAVLSNPEGSKRILEPSECPICATELDKRTLLYRCPNDSCPSRGIKALEQAVSKNYFNIENLSTRTLEQLVETGLVRDIADIFALEVSELASLPTGDTYETATADHAIGDSIPLGDLTALKIFESIERARATPPAKILSALNIPLLGRSLGRNLIREFGTISALLEASPQDLIAVDLISDRKAEIVWNGLQARRDLLEKLAKFGVNVFASAPKRIESPRDATSAQEIESLRDANLPGDKGSQSDANSLRDLPGQVESLRDAASRSQVESQSDANNLRDLPLRGKTVVISGSVPGYNRDQARDLVEDLGGVSAGSVSKNTTLVVAEESSSSSKVTKAKQLGIQILSAPEFLKLCGL